MTECVEIPLNVQTLIWDLDGTLLDSFDIYKHCLNESLRRCALPLASEQILRNNHHGHIEDSIANVLREMGQEVTEARYADVMRGFYELDNVYINDVDSYLFPDALGLAERARQAGKHQIVVTSRPDGIDRGNGSPRNLIANSRLSRTIAVVVSGDDSVYRKPDRRLLEARFGAALSELGNPIVIGDQFVDAELAGNLECPCILVARTGTIAHLDRLANRSSHVRVVPTLLTVAV